VCSRCTASKKYEEYKTQEGERRVVYHVFDCRKAKFGEICVPLIEIVLRPDRKLDMLNTWHTTS
jgi:hypothetical protein